MSKVYLRIGTSEEIEKIPVMTVFTQHGYQFSVDRGIDTSDLIEVEEPVNEAAQAQNAIMYYNALSGAAFYEYEELDQEKNSMEYLQQQVALMQAAIDDIILGGGM